MLGTVKVQQDDHAAAKQEAEQTQEAEAEIPTMEESEPLHVEGQLLGRSLISEMGRKVRVLERELRTQRPVRLLTRLNHFLKFLKPRKQKLSRRFAYGRSGRTGSMV